MLWFVLLHNQYFTILSYIWIMMLFKTTATSFDHLNYGFIPLSVSFFHLNWSLMNQINCKLSFLQFSVLCYDKQNVWACNYQFRRDHESSDFRQLAVNKLIYQKKNVIIFLIIFFFTSLNNCLIKNCSFSVLSVPIT